MSRLSILLLSLLFVSACSPTEDPPPSKTDARAQVGKGDGIDFCELFDWYNDGECDDFCATPDPDCSGEQYCYNQDDCDQEQRCNADEICLSPCEEGETCAQVCAGFCVEDPTPGPDACSGAWADQFGTCRTPSDGVYPDQCCFGAICGGFANLPCASEDEWCSISQDQPDGSADFTGVCKPRPQACLQIFAPVCGTDGEDYGNECQAHAAGTNVASEGECPSSIEICGGFANLSCEDTQWCDFPEVPAGAESDLSGVCRERPQACTFEFNPVCGLDGNTYSNACNANAAGTDVTDDDRCE